MTAEEFLNRLKKIPKIIENCELQKQFWEAKARNTTAGGVTIKLLDKKGEEELHNMEKVQSSSKSDPVGVAVPNYVDIERKIEALKVEKAKAEALLEQLPANQYDILFKFYILEYALCEIAYCQKKATVSISTNKKIALNNLQKLLDNNQMY